MNPSRYILPLLLIALSGLLYVLYIQDTYQEILALQANKKDIEDALASAGQIQSLQATLLGQKSAISEEDQEKLEKLLPTSYDPIRVIFDLNTFISKHNLSLKNPTINVVPPKEGAVSNERTTINIMFSISAPYTIFRTFMADLERNLALRDIQSIKIAATTGDAGASESSVLSYQIEVQGYAYQDQTKPEI